MTLLGLPVVAWLPIACWAMVPLYVLALAVQVVADFAHGSRTGTRR